MTSPGQPTFQQSPSETLTEREAHFLEAIGRGENPCARIGEESSRVTGSRRRAVGGLRRKGYVRAPRQRTNIVGKLVEVDEPPRLTDKGAAWVEARRVEEARSADYCECGHACDEHEAGGVDCMVCECGTFVGALEKGGAS